MLIRDDLPELKKEIYLTGISQTIFLRKMQLPSKFYKLKKRKSLAFARVVA